MSLGFYSEESGSSHYLLCKKIFDPETRPYAIGGMKNFYFLSNWEGRSTEADKDGAWTVQISQLSRF